MIKTIYAKSLSQGGTLLTDHTKMVLNLGYSIAKGYPYFNDEDTVKEFLVSLILHDIGKCTSQYQDIMMSDMELDSEDVETPMDKIKKDSPFYYHNTISWAFALSCIKGIRPTGSNPYKHYPILSSILYHHTVKNDDSVRPCDVISSLTTDEITLMEDFYKEMCEYVKETFGIDILSKPDYLLVDDPTEYVGHTLGEEKLFIDKKECKGDGYYLFNTSKSLVTRSVLNYSDRIVSSRVYDNSRILENDVEYISSIYTDRINRNSIIPVFDGYDEKRLSVQRNVVDECFLNKDINTNVICASAGFGKTLMGILTYLKYKKKTLWVLPTLELCRSTYASVIDELKSLHISDDVSVGLFYSNEFKEGNLDSDIIIIGIDALLGRLSKNNLTPLFYDGITTNVIFDEYHEFLMKEPLFAAFINLVHTRKDYTNASTFLLSATPLKFDSLWGTKNIRYWEDMPILGENVRVHIGHKVMNSVLGDEEIEHPENSISILPTVDSAQKGYMNSGKQTLLIHSRFNEEDRKEKINEVFNVYGKYSTVVKKTPLIGTNIIGTGFNISARILNDYIITPMRTIQTIGRGSRFCEYDDIEYNFITSSLNVDTGIKKLIEESASKYMQSQWIDVLDEYDCECITKKELYRIYNDFMQKYKNEWDRYFSSCFTASSDNLTRIKYVSGNYKKSNDDTLSRSYTYRGESSNFYATVHLKDDSYLSPIVCDSGILYRENSDGGILDDPKTRYYFMLSGVFNFPNKDTLKYRWKIVKNYDATTDKCLGLAKSKDCPLLLCNFNYNSSLGLYRKDLFK